MLAERAAAWPKEWMAEGRRITLAELLEERFGPIGSRYGNLIAKATESQLKRWLKAVLTASSADEIFRV